MIKYPLFIEKTVHLLKRAHCICIFFLFPNIFSIFKYFCIAKSIFTKRRPVFRLPNIFGGYRASSGKKNTQYFSAKYFCRAEGIFRKNRLVFKFPNILVVQKASSEKKSTVKIFCFKQETK